MSKRNHIVLVLMFMLCLLGSVSPVEACPPGFQDVNAGACRVEIVSSGSNPTAAGLIACNSYAKYDSSTTGSTQIIALSGTTVTYICGYSIMVGGTATNVKLVQGTGANCVTSPVDLTPAWQFTTNSGKVAYSSFYAGLNAPAGKATCVNASAANAVQVEIWYTQF